MPDTGYAALHEAACARGETTYADPETGFVVFTRDGLLARERCCGAGCRHCPFEHESVPLNRRASRIQQAAWLSDARPQTAREVTILFWSGGKDSFLAYRALQRLGTAEIILLTTFDARSRIIAHQEFDIGAVVEQAKALKAPLIGVPLHSGIDYVDQIVTALALVPECWRLAFGDLHLEHIRGWREEAFANHPQTRDLALDFPLWHAEYDQLMADLEASGAKCQISAVGDALSGVGVGDPFNRDFVARLSDEIDAFGENGEFHTKIVI
ncbi:MAG: DUF5522 domain-containing protein [Pseudomonadota bacterium]